MRSAAPYRRLKRRLVTIRRSRRIIRLAHLLTFPIYDGCDPCRDTSPNSPHEDFVRGELSLKSPLYRGARLDTAFARRLGVPNTLSYRGNPAILDGDTICFLYSRGPRSGVPSDPYVRAMIDRFAEYATPDTVIVTSYGTLFYELAACLARRAGNPVVVCCNDVLPEITQTPGDDACPLEYHDLFDGPRTLWVSPFAPEQRPAKRDRLRLRDCVVAALSDRLVVGRMRKGGNVEHLVTTAESVGIPVLREKISPDASKTGELPRTSVSEYPGEQDPSSAFTVTVTLEQWPEPGEWLVHYTRSCPGPWPQQRRIEYYDSLIDDRPDAAHTAFDTLCRILTQRRIIGSARLIRGPHPCVSFTECLPGEIRDIMKWRTGLIRWSFEPYGIAIRKEFAEQLGARPTVYGDEELHRTLPPDDIHRFQLLKPGGKDWRIEREWRVKGDVHLKSIPWEAQMVIVPTVGEARRIQDRFGNRVTLAGIPWPPASEA